MDRKDNPINAPSIQVGAMVGAGSLCLKCDPAKIFLTSKF
jgi:hypothetical protein